jgi:nucleoside-triphosphatase THEP1
MTMINGHHIQADDPGDDAPDVGSQDIGAVALLQGEGEPGDGQAAALIEAFALRRQGEGWAVAGLIQRRDPETGNRHLVDLETGTTFPITQILGPGSDSCVVDPHGVAAATAVLRRALENPPDIMVVNKFGRLESEGEGLVDETLAAMAEGVAVLTSVHANFRALFEDRTGGMATLLPCAETALEDWWSTWSKGRVPRRGAPR